MSSQLSSRLGTEIFQLTAEGGGKSFVVHKNLLTIQSSFLQSVIDPLSIELKYDLHSWDGETVGHFVNFLYLHTYVAPKPQPLHAIAGAPDGETSDTTGTHSRVSTPRTISSNDSTERDHTIDQTDPRPLTPLSGLRDQPDDGDNDGPDSAPSPVAVERLYGQIYPQETHDYLDVLLAHARVYVLAELLEIHALSSMAYHRLLVILENLHPITPGSRIKLNVVELLRYVYANTQDTGDRMRKLVSQFVALNFVPMHSLKETVELANEGGQVTVDLMAKVCRRLVAGEEELDKQREISKAFREVTEQLRIERLNVAALALSKDRVEKSLTKVVLDMNNSLQQLKVVISKGPAGGHQWIAVHEIEALRVKNEKLMKAMDAGEMRS